MLAGEARGALFEIGKTAARPHVGYALQGGADFRAVGAQQLGLFVGGLAPLASPLLGSLLVVSPIAVTLLSTDLAGAASMSVSWPLGIPAGTRAFFQAFVVDPAGSFVASPGLAAVGS